jgi:alpha-tubulin suppressor-like RCC1 family protein
MRSNYTITATNTAGSSSVNITIAAFFSNTSPYSEGICWWNASNVFKCFGDNTYGELGNGTTTSSTSFTAPTASAAQGANAITLWSQDACDSQCFLSSSGAVYCAGSNAGGNLGNGGSGTNITSYAQAIGLSSGFTQLSGFWNGYCAVNSSGSLMCWGTPSGSVFGSSITSEQSTPTAVSVATNITYLTMGKYHACAITSSNIASCWGTITTVAGTLWTSATAATMSGITNPVQANSMLTTTCFVGASGTVGCFGANEDYQINGTGTANGTTTLTAISNLSSVVQVIGAGWGLSASSDQGTFCALLNTGKISCWGSNTYGQLGQGTTGSPNGTPTAITSLSNVVAIQGFGYDLSANGGGGFCASLQSGSVVCWGYMTSATFDTPTLTTISGMP